MALELNLDFPFACFGVAESRQELFLARQTDALRHPRTLINDKQFTSLGLVELFGENILDDELSKLILPKTGNGEPGLTTVCREILLKEGRSLTANETVRLIQKRFPSVLAEHKVPVSSVMTVLNRLVKYGEADSVFVGKRRAWQKARGER